MYRKDVGEVAVITLGPNVVAGRGFDQLSSDTDAVAGFTQAAFEHVAHAQFAPDLANLDRAALVGEAGVTRDDEQRRIARQCGDHVLGDAVGENSCAGSSLIFVKGKTGIEGLSGSSKVVAAGTDDIGADVDRAR